MGEGGNSRGYHWVYTMGEGGNSRGYHWVYTTWGEGDNSRGYHWVTNAWRRRKYYPRIMYTGKSEPLYLGGASIVQ